MIFTPIVFASMAMVVLVNEVPDWQKGGALAQMQFEVWYLQLLYPDEDVVLSPDLVRSKKVYVRETRRSPQPVPTIATTSTAR
jgi:hypothetical protein